MSDGTVSAEIREMLRNTPISELLTEEIKFADYRSWRTADRSINLYIGRGSPFNLRGFGLSEDNRPFFHQAGIRIGRHTVYFYLRSWVDFVIEGSRKLSSQFNLSLELINTHCDLCINSKDIDEACLTEISHYVKHAAQYYLKGRVEKEAREQSWWANKTIKVSGRLHEHWSHPRPEIVELVSTIENYASGFNFDRLSKSIPENYTIGKTNFRDVATIDGRDDVRIWLPTMDRDERRISGGSVTIGNVNIPIQVDDSIAFNLPNLKTVDGKSVTYISLLLISHPLSLRLESGISTAGNITPALVTEATIHMRNSILKVRNPTPGYNTIPSDVLSI
jgi:hypothetical protein